MLENIKKYWFLYVPLSVGIVWLVNIDSRIHDSAEHKVEHDNDLKNSLTPEQKWRKHYRDSAETVSQDEKRAASLRQQIKSDSIKRRSDSLTLEAVNRLTIQMQQTKDEVKEIKSKIDN